MTRVLFVCVGNQGRSLMAERRSMYNQVTELTNRIKQNSRNA